MLRLLSEQGAVPLDQVVGFLDGEFERAVSLLGGLEEAGCVERRRFLVRDHPWFWPSRRGAVLVGTGFHYQRPDVALIAHRRAINQICLYLRQRAPDGRWVCERTLHRRRDPNAHLPDAVFEIGAERHAIEAELSHKRRNEIYRIVAEHSDRYDAVIYFCVGAAHSLLRRVQAEGRWPKLIVRPLSETEQC